MTTPSMIEQANLAQRLRFIATAHERLRAATRALRDDELRATTCLPGWTRGHVLAHLAVLASAFARQADRALREEIIDVYDGGRPGRAAAIERVAGTPAAELRQTLERGLAALEQSWTGLSPADWNRPVAYRNSTLSATQLCWWREVEIHSVDLDIGYLARDWNDELTAHVVGHLLPRLPRQGTFRLTAEDTGRRWTRGAGEEIDIQGPQHVLAAWLSGRMTDPPRTTGTARPALELGPWP